MNYCFKIQAYKTNLILIIITKNNFVSGKSYLHVNYTELLSIQKDLKSSLLFSHID